MPLGHRGLAVSNLTGSPGILKHHAGGEEPFLHQASSYWVPTLSSTHLPWQISGRARQRLAPAFRSSQSGQIKNNYYTARYIDRRDSETPDSPLLPQAATAGVSQVRREIAGKKDVRGKGASMWSPRGTGNTLAGAGGEKQDKRPGWISLEGSLIEVGR